MTAIPPVHSHSLHVDAVPWGLRMLPIEYRRTWVLSTVAIPSHCHTRGLWCSCTVRGALLRLISWWNPLSRPRMCVRAGILLLADADCSGLVRTTTA